MWELELGSKIFISPRVKSGAGIRFWVRHHSLVVSGQPKTNS